MMKWGFIFFVCFVVFLVLFFFFVFFQVLLCWGAVSIFIYKLLNMYNPKMTQCTTICLEPVSNKAWYRHFARKN